MKPLAVIVDGSSTEDRPFLDGIKDQMVDAPRTTLIELPARAQSRLSWISKLDATALAGKWRGTPTLNVEQATINQLYRVE